MGENVVAIVDGFSTGRFFAAILRNRGYTPIHIQSRMDIPSSFLQSLHKEEYENHFVHDGDLSKLLNLLSQYSISAVIAGSEFAIELTDKLAEVLKLPGNPPKSSEIRRNKFAMLKAVNDGGLATAKQCKSTRLDEILSWHAKELNHAWPVVVKPVNSGGTDGVRFCYNTDEIAAAVENIVGKKNLMGILNTDVVVQSFLSGQEYIVNTVSCFGKHHLTDIRRCYKKQVQGAGYVSGCEEFVPANEILSQQLKSYAFKALDILQISHGPAHFEIMLTSNGPHIIEMGARVQGGIDPASNAACLGSQQLDKTIDAYLEPSHFVSYHQQDYHLQQFGAWVFLISEQIGKVISVPFIDKVKTLSSFFSLHMNVKPGDDLRLTIDYSSSPGNVHLVNTNQTQLMDDIQQLRKFELEGFVVCSDS